MKMKKGWMALTGVLVIGVMLMITGCDAGDGGGKPSYTVTVAAGILNGSITASPTRATAGTNITLTITPHNGYRLKAGSLAVKETGGTKTVTVGADNIFKMPAYNVTVSGEFESTARSPTYNVTVASGITNGSITSNPTSAEAGEDITLTITADANYRLKEGSLSVKQADGTDVPFDGTGNSRTFIMPASDVTVSGEFESTAGMPTYDVTVPGTISGGSITANHTSATAGTDITLTITANGGYQLKADSLSVKRTDGTDVPFSGTGSIRTFTMPASDVAVSGEFERVYTVTAPGTITGGSITASSASTTAGATITLTITAGAGYRLKADSLSVKQTDGIDVSFSGTGNSRTFTMPASDVTVSGEFESTAGMPTYDVTVPGTISGGSITASPASAHEGDTVTLTITATDANYQFKTSSLNVTETGGAGTVAVGGNRTFTMPAYGVTVSGEFERVYTVTVAGGITNGTITASPTRAVAGTEITLTASPATDYQFKVSSLSVKRTDNGTNITDTVSAGTIANTGIFTMPASDVDVSGEFERVYAVAIASRTGGSITANPPKGTEGTAIILTITAESGYRYKVGSLSVKRTDETTVTVNSIGETVRSFIMPASNVNVSGEFESTATYTITAPEAIANGSITASSNSAPVGATVTLTIVANKGYQFKTSSLSIKRADGTDVSFSGTGNTRTFKMPASNVSISGEFESIPVYTITAPEAIEGGSITASLASATAGTKITLTIITENSSYRLIEGSLYVTETDGQRNVSVNYADNTFTMPAYNVTVKGEFERMYTITVASGIIGGSIEIEEDLTVSPVHQSIYLYITADEGYQLKAGSLSVKRTDNNTNVTVNPEKSGFIYYFNMPASNVTVNVEFERVYTIEAPGTISGGSITASSDIAPAGATITLTINPNSGYQLKEGSLTVTGTGGTTTVNGTGNTRTFTMPEYNVTVSGEFERVYTVTVAKGIIGGSITASPTIGPVGTEITLTIKANSGYHYQEDSLIVQQINGTDITDISGTGSTRTFTMPANNVTVSGEFDLEEATIAIEFTGFGDEDIDLSASDYTLSMNSWRSLTVTVSGAYTRYRWYVDEDLWRWENSNTITVYGDDFNTIGPHTITAVVEKDGVPYSKNLTIMVVR